MKGFKGFGKGLICRGKQYAENAVFEEPKATICKRGLHFCENPLDVLDYYPLLNDDVELNEFAEVEALDETATDDNKKFCTTKLKIGAKLTLAGFVKAAIDFAFEKRNGNIADSGYYAQLASSGDSAQLASSGYSAKLASSGDSAKLASSGYSAQLASSGKYSVVAGVGIKNIAKAALGSWIVLAEWERDINTGKWTPKCVKTAQVDGETLKPDTYYALNNGEFVEA